MPQIIISKKRNKASVSLGRQTIVLRKKTPRIYCYDDVYIEPPAVYIDGGLYNQEGAIADAGFYNTSSWEIVWDGGTP